MGNIFITGGSRGMGKAVAFKFAQQGHNVAITYEKNRVAAEDVVNQLKALGRDAIALALKLDDPGSIDAAFTEFEQHFGKLDYLFNNAGIFMGSKSLSDQTWQDWEKLMRVNVIGQWYCTKAAVSIMEKNGGGAIVYNTSISGTTAFPNAADYAASKHAAVGMVKGHAIECAPKKIRVNGICTGFIRTDMFDEYFGAAESYLADTKIPARRVGTVEEVASLAYWLLVEATYCYGTNIVLDGGITIGPIAVPG